MAPSAAALDVVVLVPTINAADDLERCLAALARQTWRPFRVLVVDGRSTDRTPELVARFGCEHLVDDSSTRADALNRALAELRCDVVVFTDDDCYPPPDWLGNLVRHFADPEVAGVGGPNVAPPDQSLAGKVVDVGFAARWLMTGSRYGRTGGRFCEIDHNSGCNAAYRKAVLDEAGGFPSGSIGCEDVALDERIRARGHRLWFDPAAVTYHRRRDRLRSLGRQMRSYGRGRVHVNRRFPAAVRPTHALPARAVVAAGVGAVGLLAVTGLALAAPAGLADPGRAAVRPLAALALAGGATYYAAGAVGAALGGSPYRTVSTVALAPIAMAWIHFSFGLGYLSGWREIRRGRLAPDLDVGAGKHARGR